ncbi:uncharacterized protein LOC112153772 isoform X1 [Oryzias melastigma]|uniref:uncharacterized protein LOC112153772 isoform X1 n=2 Tax=Oryzias melastigma TaxID=30732 RepID=UPI000CF7E1E9|nr:uncharacterized protein LOC112153772 isoform X1 [Oryzias melastigma]
MLFFTLLLPICSYLSTVITEVLKVKDLRSVSEMESELVSLCVMVAAFVTPVSAEGQLGMIESLILAVQRRPWLLGVYVFVIGLPVILFISFMWPDKRFGPPNQPYYYKKSDDVQPDDPEFLSSGQPTIKGSLNGEECSAKHGSSTHKRTVRTNKTKS